MMKKYIFALSIFILPLSVLASTVDSSTAVDQSSVTNSKAIGTGGTVPASELVDYSKKKLETQTTQTSETVEMPPKVRSGGTVDVSEVINFKKITAETSQGETVDVSPKTKSGGTVSTSEIRDYQTIKFETEMGKKMEFIRALGAGEMTSTVSASSSNSIDTTIVNESVDYKKNIVVGTDEKISMQDKKVYVGGDEVKVMPDKAIDSVTAQTGNSEITKVELKKDTTSANDQYVKYEVSSNQDVKILGLFSKNMEVKSTVDAQTGSVTKVEKPWWKFLAF